MAAHPFSRKKSSIATAIPKYTPNWQVWRPYKAMETCFVAVPGCKKSEEEIGKALTGTWREERLLLQLALWRAGF
jgi:hypothetical protein